MRLIRLMQDYEGAFRLTISVSVVNVSKINAFKNNSFETLDTNGIHTLTVHK